jgi:hypothetical protein
MSDGFTPGLAGMTLLSMTCSPGCPNARWYGSTTPFAALSAIGMPPMKRAEAVLLRAKATLGPSGGRRLPRRALRPRLPRPWFPSPRHNLPSLGPRPAQEHAKALYARLLKAEGDRLKVAVKVFEVRAPNEIEGVVAEAASWGADGLTVATTHGLLQPYRARIADPRRARRPA